MTNSDPDFPTQTPAPPGDSNSASADAAAPTADPATYIPGFRPIEGGKRRKIALPPLPELGNCHFFVKHKNRFCKMEVGVNKHYCGEHDLTRERVTCPVDPSHSVPKDSLKKHLRKCRPEKVRSALYKPYFSPDINSGSAPINILNNRGRTHQIEENKLDLTSGKSVMNAIREMPRHDLMRFVERVEFIFKQAWKEFHEQAGSADVIAEKLETLTTETAFETVVMSHPSTEPLTQLSRRGRQYTQLGSLLGHMQSRDLLLQNGTYVELGSGSAEFSDALANAIRGTPSFLLVDRKSFKHAHDSRIRESPYCKSVTRIVVDIKDLKLSKVEALQQQDVNIQDNISNNIATATKIVGIAKHLCGAATDISLRCLSGYQQDVQGGVEGAIITVCCHHACSFTSYINPEYLEKHSISQRDFGFLSVLSAWATCWGLEGKVSVGKVATTMTTAATTIGEKRNIDQFQDGEERSDMDNGDDDDDDEEDAHAVAGEIHGDEAGEENCNSKSDSHWSGMDLEHRREFGRRCKRILDLGRALHLQKMGLQVELAYYVPKEMSLENMMLIVKTRKIVD